MRVIYFLAAALLSLTAVQAQDRFGQIQNLIPRDKTGINQFDVKKILKFISMTLSYSSKHIVAKFAI